MFLNFLLIYKTVVNIKEKLKLLLLTAVLLFAFGQICVFAAHIDWNGGVHSISAGDYNNNVYSGNGGAFSIINNAIVDATGMINFNSNSANYGGGIYNIQSSLAIADSSVSFISNFAGGGGIGAGGGISNEQSSLTIVNSSVNFISNLAGGGGRGAGGGIYNEQSSLTITNSIVSFISNSTGGGGDSAGGGIYNSQSSITIANSTVNFISNSAIFGGGIANVQSSIAFSNSIVNFISNSANAGGGIANTYSSITFSNSIVNFISNSAILGGGIFSDINSASSIITFNNSTVSFISNSANIGGAIYYISSTLSFNNSSTSFISNTAGTDGGAIYLLDSNLTMSGDIIFQGNKAANEPNDIKALNSKVTLIAGEGEKIIFGGGMLLDSGSDLIKEGLGEVIMRGRNEVLGNDGVSIRGGVLALATAAFKASAMTVTNRSAYKTYRGSEAISAGTAVTDITGQLRVESSTISIGLYFIGSATEADLIKAGNITITNALLNVTAYGTLQNLNDVKIMQWTGTMNGGFGTGGWAQWYDDSGLHGSVGYQLDYTRNPNELWLVITTYTVNPLNPIIPSLMSYNQRQADTMLNAINVSNNVNSKIKTGVSAISDDMQRRNTLGQLSGEFLANVLKNAALMDDGANIFPRIQEGNGKHSPFWLQGNLVHQTRQEYLSDRQYNAQLLGAQVGIDLEYGMNKLLGIYASFLQNRMEQDKDRGTGEDITVGIYGAAFFENILNLKWTISGGIQNYETDRTVEIGALTYTPHGEFQTISVRGAIETEFKFKLIDKKSFQINPVLGLRAAYIANDKIEETVGQEANLIVNGGGYSRLIATLGVIAKGKGGFEGGKISLYGGYIIQGAPDYAYDMQFKEAQEFGKMQIRAGDESKVFVGLSAGYEKDISANLSLFINADIKADPVSDTNIINGYSGILGIKIKLGEKLESLVQMPDSELIENEPAQQEKDKEVPLYESKSKDDGSLLLDDLNDLSEALLAELIAEFEEKEKQILQESQERRLHKLESFRLSAATFEFGSAVLSAQAEEEIKKIAEKLKVYDYSKITVEGHADSIGGKFYNQRLSILRAKAVYEQLIKNGIIESKIKYIGFDYTMPIADNKTKIGRQKNRRVEIFVE